MKFAVENFKIFKERQEFDLKPMTILVGPNGSGKSSVINALELLNMAGEKPHINYTFNETFVNILKQIPNEQIFKNYPFRALLHNYNAKEFSLECFGDGYEENFNPKIKLTYKPDKNDYFGYLQKLEVFLGGEVLYTLMREKRNKWRVGINIQRLHYKFSIENAFFEEDQETPYFRVNSFLEESFLKYEDVFSIIEGYDGLEEILMAETLLRSKSMIFYTTEIKDLYELKFSLRNLLGSIENNQKKLGFLNFSDNTNGRTAKNFFEDYLSKTFQSYLDDCFKTFNKSIFLNTNRTILDEKAKYTQPGNFAFVSMLVAQLNKKQSSKYLSYVSICMGIIFGKKVTNLQFAFDENGNISISYLKNKIFTKLQNEAQGIISVFGILATICYHLLNDNSDKERINGYFYEEIGLGSMLGELHSDFQLNVLPRCFVLQEPEMNLHPNAQSNFADALTIILNSIQNANHRFILETHSEYIIRRFQYLVAKGEIKKEAIQIYYFNDPDKIQERDEVVYPINIDDDGSLNRPFGPGFYDEIGNIALKLLLLNKEQKN